MTNPKDQDPGTDGPEIADDTEGHGGGRKGFKEMPADDTEGHGGGRKGFKEMPADDTEGHGGGRKGF